MYEDKGHMSLKEGCIVAEYDPFSALTVGTPIGNPPTYDKVALYQKQIPGDFRKDEKVKAEVEKRSLEILQMLLPLVQKKR